MRPSLAPSAALCAALLWLGPGCAKDEASDSTGTPASGTPAGSAATGTGTGAATGTGTGATTGTGTGAATGTGTGVGTGTATGSIATTCAIAIVDPDAVNCTAEYWTAPPGAAAQHAYDTFYDGCGRIAGTDYLNPSGLVYSEQRYHYDAAGLLISITIDGDGLTPPDGLTDTEIALVYDASDRVLRLETWVGGAYSCASHNTYADPDPYSDEVDDDCTNTLTTYVRQLDGDPISSEVDAGRDGTIDATTSWTYDQYDTPESMLTVSAYATTRVWYTYVNDQITRFEMDLGDDGSIEVVSTYAYDALGRLIETTTAGFGAAPTVTTGTWACLP